MFFYVSLSSTASRRVAVVTLLSVIRTMAVPVLRLRAMIVQDFPSLNVCGSHTLQTPVSHCLPEGGSGYSAVRHTDQGGGGYAPLQQPLCIGSGYKKNSRQKYREFEFSTMSNLYGGTYFLRIGMMT